MDTRKPMNSRKIKDAESYHQSFNFPDLWTYQKEFNFGQARINFQLNEVDKDFIKTLKVIVAALKTIKDLPQFTQELSAIDFNTICEALTDAETRSTNVAGIRPPGCDSYPA